MKNFAIALMGILGVVGTWQLRAADAILPEGWKKIKSTKGVQAWEHSFRHVVKLGIKVEDEELSECVLEINLQRGQLRSLIGSAQKQPDDEVQGRFTEAYWNAALRNNTDEVKLMALINGTYFKSHDLIIEGLGSGKTSFAYALKKDGAVLAFGIETEAKPNRRQNLRGLCWNDDWADVVKYEPELLDDKSWNNVVVGIGDGYPVDEEVQIGRSLAGVCDRNADGKCESLLFFISPAATQKYAINCLTEFGADPKRLVMLDGGSSCRSMIDGEYIIRGNILTRKLRKFPHCLALYGSIKD